MTVHYSTNQTTQDGLKYLSKVLTKLNVDINPILQRIRQTSCKEEREKIIAAIAKEALEIESRNLPEEELRVALKENLILAMNSETLIFINNFYTKEILKMSEGNINRLQLSQKVISLCREITAEILDKFQHFKY